MEIQRDLILRSFLAESDEGLAEMEQSILQLESSPADLELVQTIFRVVHTMKGNAGILGLESLLSFAHTLEDLLDGLRKGNISVTSEITAVLLASLDALREMAAAASQGKDETSRNANKTLAEISRCLKSRSKTARSKRTKQEPVEETSIEEAVAQKNEEAVPADSALATKQASQGEVAHTLRVDMEKLDRLLSLVGEITIARGRMTQLLDGKEQTSIDQIREAHRLTDSLCVELQEMVLKTRMVSVGPLFRRYNRTVRDLAKTHGKLAQIQIEGEDVEVDASVVEHLKDPLLHMIRNALDHGIETPEVRRAQNKPEAGTITVRAKHEGGNILIEVSDDGAGLDRKKIVELAEKRGLLTGNEALSSRDIDQLIFESGFSTAHEVSDLSGRGVGMDVVQRNVHALRGSVYITSEPGIGSVVHLRIPLTLAIIEGFAVGVGEEIYIIPLDQVVECTELPEEVENVTRNEGILPLRNEPLPFIYLKDYFGLAGTPASRQSIVVVQRDSIRAGLAVDVLFGAIQTVIKPLPAVFKNVSGVFGLAILGNGKVALILDVPELFRDYRMQAALVS